MQGDDGLPGAWTAVHDESAAGAGADDGVLVGLDGAEHVLHPGRPAAAEAGDEGGLVVERGVPPKPVRGEHLVPVVADPATCPAIPAPARQAHRVAVGGSEERLGRGRAPVDQQPTTFAVGEAEPSDVHRLRVVGADHVAEAQVQPEAAQEAQPSGQPVDLQVPVHRLLADAAGRPALDVEAIGQLGDRPLEGRRDGREVLLVSGDQRRVGLAAEAVRQRERTGRQLVHAVAPIRHPYVDKNTGTVATPVPLIDLGRRFCGMTRVLPQDPWCAIRWKWKGAGAPFLFRAREGRDGGRRHLGQPGRPLRR